MKNLMRLAFFMLLIDCASAQSFNPNLAAKLQDALDQLVANSVNTKGMTASVAYPGQGIWNGASGESQLSVPITSEMELAIASNSKLFTAVTLLKLAESGVIDLDDALHMWIPDYPNVDPAITIRQLLNHTSGVADMYSTQAQHDFIESDPNRIWTPEEVLSWIGPANFSPGTGYSYSNTNYILAGMVAKSATGDHISKLIREGILAPLQLDRTFFPINETVGGTIARPWRNGVDIGSIPRTSLHSAIGAAGAMYSTPNDMAKWYQALMSGQIIGADSLSQMTAFGGNGNYGLGIAKYTFNGRTVWGHGGNTEGYRNRTIYDPQMKAAIVGLSNSNPSGVDGITVLLHKVLVDYLPESAGDVTGLTSVCQGQSSVSYAVAPIANATSYDWTLPAGAAGASSTNSISVNFGASSVAGSITVRGTNMYGSGAASTLAVAVNHWVVSAENACPPLPPSTPPVITGANPGIGRVVLSFVGSGSGGSPPAGYTATCSAPGKTTRVATGSASPITVTGLVGGALYSCTVTETNVAGSGPPSNAFAVTPGKLAIAPILMLLLD